MAGSAADIAEHAVFADERHIGNVDAIADKLEDMTDTDVDIIADAPRPVPLTYEYTLDPLEKTVELAFGRGETPIYVVHFSQDAALETANALASTGVSSKEQRAAIAEAIKARSSPRVR